MTPKATALVYQGGSKVVAGGKKKQSRNGVVAEGNQFAPAPILLLVPTYLQLRVAVRPFSLSHIIDIKEGQK